ncbi:MAG: hypothetical protein WB475_16145, partial [Pseudolabrys sp.]
TNQLNGPPVTKLTLSSNIFDTNSDCQKKQVSSAGPLSQLTIETVERKRHRWAVCEISRRCLVVALKRQ